MVAHYVLEEAQAGLPGHVEIAQDHVEALTLQEAAGLQAVGGDGALIAGTAQ